jgi:hypothetical protein
MNSFEFDVSLRTYSFDVEPSEICALLNRSPKRIWRIGDPRVSPSGTRLNGNYEESYCSFPITREGDEELEELIERLANSLIQHKDLFARIRAGGGRIDLFVGWYSVGNTGAVFSSVLMKLLSDLHIDLSLDGYGDQDLTGGDDRLT